MSDTTFTDFEEPAVNAEWLNEVNTLVHGIFDGAATAQEAATALANVNFTMASLYVTGNLTVDGYINGVDVTTVQSIFYQATAPTANAAGDLWFDTSNGNELFRWSGSAWVSVQDTDIAQAISDAATAQATADGKVTTFYQDAAPTAEGVGDLWVDTNDGNAAYRWSGSAWVSITDADIATALSDAATAQATADGKIVSFYSASAPTAEGVGDFWTDTDDDNHLYRWSGSAWVSVRDATIAAAQSVASTALADAATAQSAADNAQATADGKIITFIQATSPTAEGVGDLWIDSDDNKMYRWNGSTWVDIQDTAIGTALSDAANAQATADGKIVSFYATSAPTAEGVGDLWIDTDDTNKLYRWSGSAWVSVSDTDIAQALSDASTAQTTADGKITTFYAASGSPPTAEGVGDLWYQTDTGILVRWNGSNWTSSVADDTVIILENGATLTSGGITLSSGGAISSVNKTSYADTDDGVYFGWDATESGYVINIGSATKYLKYDATDGLQVTTGSTSTKSIQINPGGDNEIHFWGNNGTVVEELATIGINTIGSDSVIGNFGSGTATNAKLALRGESYSKGGVLGKSASNVGVTGLSTSSFGVVGGSSSGYGMEAYITTSPGKAQLFLQPIVSFAEPTHSAWPGSVWSRVSISNSTPTELWLNTSVWDSSSPAAGTSWEQLAYKSDIPAAWPSTSSGNYSMSLGETYTFAKGFWTIKLSFTTGSINLQFNQGGWQVYLSTNGAVMSFYSDGSIARLTSSSHSGHSFYYSKTLIV